MDDPASKTRETTTPRGKETTRDASFGARPKRNMRIRLQNLQSIPRQIELTPLRVTAVYLIFGFAALYGSDVLLVRYFDDPVLSRLQALKGGAEVLVTGGLIYVLTRGARAPLKAETGRLQRQQEELEVLHRILRHNLRNQLDSIKGFAELLYDSTDEEQTKEWCGEVLRSTTELLEYTEQAHEVRKIANSSHDGPTQIDLATTIPRILDRNEYVTDEVDVSVDIPEDAVVQANHMLDKAIDELVTNAIQHNDSSEPTVSISVDEGAGLISMTRIQIRDNGPGLPSNTKDVIEQATEDPLTHMSGLGLWMVHWIMIESNGSMTIESDETGTQITLTIPSGY